MSRIGSMNSESPELKQIMERGKPPLPNDIIPLGEIPKIKFYNTSFREYLGVCNGYVIGVYPFAIRSTWAIDVNGNAVDYDDIRYYPSQQLHHQDFTKGEIDADPCDIYEKVSVVSIHSDNNADKHLMNKDHTNDVKEFESHLKSITRENKLNEIGI